MCVSVCICVSQVVEGVGVTGAESKISEDMEANGKKQQKREKKTGPRPELLHKYSMSVIFGPSGVTATDTILQ